MNNNKKRWFIVVGAIIIQLCLGAIYAWSVFRKPLERTFIILKTIPISDIEKIEILAPSRIDAGPESVPVTEEKIFINRDDLVKIYTAKGKYPIEGIVTKINSNTIIIKRGFTPTEATLPFALVLVVNAFAMILGGLWQDKKGPRIVALTGGFFLGCGLILTGLLKSFLGILISYGVISGIGIGLAYVCPVSASIKWFPDMRGLITGIAVAGFGAGALIVAPVARSLIDIVGLFNTFIILGVSFLILVTIGALILKDPPIGYKPAGWIPNENSLLFSGYNFSPKEMLQTYQFYLIWFIYFLGCATGLMIIGQTAPIGQDIATLSKEKAAIAVSILSIFNAAGRIFWGKISDFFSRMKTIFLIFLICGSATILYTIINQFNFYYWIGVSLVGLCFGGYLSVFPSLIADYYGTQHVGANYGLTFTAFGVGGLLGNIIAPQILEKTKSYNPIFIIAGILSFLGAIISLAIRRPKPEKNYTEEKS